MKPKPSPFRRRLPDKEWDAVFQPFKRAVAALPVDDPLWRGLIALLDRYVQTETEASVNPLLDDAEAHRFRGRLGMLLDLRRELEKFPAEAREEFLTASK